MKKYGFLYIIAAATLWGIEGVLFLPHLYSLPVAGVIFIQTFILTLLLAPFFIKRFKNFKKLSQQDWLIMSGIAFLGGVVGILAITKAFFYVNYVNLSIVVLIQKLQPVFALTLAGIFLKEKLNTRFFLWSALAIIGAYIMTFGWGFPNFNTGGERVTASLLALLAAASFGATTVLSRKVMKTVEPLDATYLRLGLSALFLLIIILFTGDYESFSTFTREHVTYFAMIIFITGGLGIFLFSTGLKYTKASISTICELAFPVTAILLEYFVRGNLLSPSQWVGVAVLFFAITQVVKK